MLLNSLFNFNEFSFVSSAFWTHTCKLRPTLICRSVAQAVLMIMIQVVARLVLVFGLLRSTC